MSGSSSSQVITETAPPLFLRVEKRPASFGRRILETIEEEGGGEGQFQSLNVKPPALSSFRKTSGLPSKHGPSMGAGS